LIEPHENYLGLGAVPGERQDAYRALFKAHTEPELLQAIRQGTQTNRVFGAAQFQKQIETTLALRLRETQTRTEEKGEWPRLISIYSGSFYSDPELAY